MPQARKTSWSVGNITIVPTRLWREHRCEMCNTWQAWRCESWSQKAQCISVAWLKHLLCCVGFRSVGLYIVTVCRPLWVLDLCLITVTNSYCLNPVMHYRTTRHQVYSQNKHISADNESLSYCLQLHQLTPKCCRRLWYTVWISDFVFCYYWTCRISSVCL